MTSEPRVLLAFDSFKGTLRSAAVADAVRRGMIGAGYPPECISVLPIGDGGEGTADAIAAATHHPLTRMAVIGPDGDSVEGVFWRRGAFAWIEAASACGLEIATSTSPAFRTSRGVGQLILAAAEAGAREIVVGCGGTATVDAGLGMLEGLGASIEPPGVTLGSLHRVERIELGSALEALRGVSVRAAVDVDNPLVGEAGAVVYAAQKGAGDLAAVRAALDHAGAVLDAASGLSCSTLPGSGAAGGIAAAVLALGGALDTGFDVVSELLGLEAILSSVDVVVTGEGRLDATTARGKLAWRVLQSAGERAVWMVVGQASGPATTAVIEAGVSGVLPLFEAPIPADLSPTEDRLEACGALLAARFRK